MDAFEAISLPDSTSAASQKLFTLAQANRALTLVRRIVADIVREYAALRDLHRSCRELEGEDTAQAEDVRERYAAATDRLSALREELEEIGCELKDYQEGLVDFPAMHEDREILLCWKLGEDKVAHWHEADTGFSGRQPIPEHWA